MTTYTAIPNGDIDQDSPLTQPLLTLVRDNPIAISEGATGAPRNQGISLDNVFAGYLTSTGTTPAALTGLDGVKQLKIAGAVNNSASSQIVQIAFSNDGGSSYGSWQSAATMTTTSFGCFEMTVNVVSGVCSGSGFYEAGTSGLTIVASSVTVPSGVDAIQIRNNATGGVIRANVYIIGGDA